MIFDLISFHMGFYAMNESSSNCVANGVGLGLVDSRIFRRNVLSFCFVLCSFAVIQWKKMARNVPIPPGSVKLISAGLLAGLGIYAFNQGLYNVEGGHRAIVFNRISGVKDQVFS